MTAANSGVSITRDEELRPTLSQVVVRGLVVLVTNALALWALDPLVSGFDMSGVGPSLLAGAVLGIVNALVWPAIAFLLVPLSVLTLGVGAIVVNALVVWLVLDQLPGVRLDGFGSALALTVGLTIVTTIVDRLLAVEDDAWFDQRMARRARRRADQATVTDVPGVVFVQIDGLSEPVLRRAVASGDVPTLHGWMTSRTHDLLGWETDWSSQTGVSQCGILHGTNGDMPAFRWIEKDTGTLMVSNHPKSAAEIERRHSDGRGLLAHHGSSYGNLFSGDAERAVLTMSGAGRVKEGKIGAGYGRYFSRPSNAIQTLLGAVADIGRERRAARDQRHRDVQPRVTRTFTYSLLRAFTTVVSRDVCVNGILGDVAEGRGVIYVDLLGYDEVAHHSGPERADTLGVLRDIDRQIRRIERSFAWAPRPYHLVVLSDHGQTQGPTFEDEFDESLEELVERLTRTDAVRDPDSVAGNTESTAWLRGTRGSGDSAADAAVGSDDLTVLASGALGLVYLPGPRRRLTSEEIDERYPELLDGLRNHPGVGFVLVRSDTDGAVVLGPGGRRLLDRADDDPTALEGDDPLAAFVPTAAAKIRRVDGFPHVADVMINARYDPVTEEIFAFEHQVGSHGALGGPQMHPFVLYPAGWSRPDEVIDGPAHLHRVLKGWLADLGQPVG